MARDIIPIIGLGDYTPDRGAGANIPRLTAKFGKPADILDADIDLILDAIAFRRKAPGDKSPCPVAGDFKPRKLIFTRQDGNSISLPLVDKSQAINTSILVRDIINAATPNNPVLCIELQGEFWKDLKLELRTATGAPVAGIASRSPSNRGKQAVHSGKINYAFDGRTGDTVPLSIKVDTDIVLLNNTTGTPSIINGTIWDGCIGDFVPNNPCPANSAILARHYVATFLVRDQVTNEEYYQQTKIPVKNFDSPDILACGVLIANSESIVCLEYDGETNKRIHILLP